MPPDMQTFEMHTSGSEDGAQIVVMDGSSTDAMGSFPPEWEERSQEVHRFDNMVLHVIDPVDLAVSEAARFNERDREDIQALAERGLINPDTFARRLEEAIDHYAGDLTLDPVQRQRCQGDRCLGQQPLGRGCRGGDPEAERCRGAGEERYLTPAA